MSKGRKSKKDKAIKEQLLEKTPKRPKKVFKGVKKEIHKLETEIFNIEKHLRIMSDYKIDDPRDYINRRLMSYRQKLKKLKKELEDLKKSVL